MTKESIKISLVWQDEHLMQYLVRINNRILSTSFKFYGDDKVFKEFGKSLISFPNDLEENIIFEIGHYGVYEYLLLDVFCYKNSGHSAIHIVIQENSEVPNFNHCEFYISTVPASLNILGHLLYNWNPFLEAEIAWEAE